MPNKPIHIAFISALDAKNKKSWSGIPYYMARALEKQSAKVSYLGPANPILALFFGKAISFLAQKILGKRFDYIHSKRISKAYSKIFSSKLRENDYNVIVAPAASSCIANLKTDIPIIYTSDCTFNNVLNYYPAYTDLTKASTKQGLEIEKKTIEKSAIVTFPSAWAANSAIKDYNKDLSKVHVFPYGANIDKAPEKEKVLSKKKGKTCRLLFLGVMWERKGGNIAFDTLKELINAGIEAELTVCGCVPPKSYVHEKMKVIPFLNKNDEKDYKAFCDLLLNSDFLILPSRKECFGIAFCEASAFGLPSLAANTGGIAGAIKEGVNGFLLPLEAAGKDYAKIIANIFNDDQYYYNLVKSSRDLYESLLNWDVWAQKVMQLIMPLVK
jgi:glycosyltransferase involved in cell wall biosynthesis